jgi:lipid II:glycine glycyltransferase (peptidoglycan interpeptide bridge formation enzyme)
MGVTWNGTGIYYYGASSYEHRNLMAPYLLQWEAMRLCKKSGCDHYDLLGISAPDSVDDPWAGISDFKRKFGGTVITYPPEQTLVLRPMVKRALGLKRKLLG